MTKKKDSNIDQFEVSFSKEFNEQASIPKELKTYRRKRLFIPNLKDLVPTILLSGVILTSFFVPLHTSIFAFVGSILTSFSGVLLLKNRNLLSNKKRTHIEIDEKSQFQHIIIRTLRHINVL